MVRFGYMSTSFKSYVKELFNIALPIIAGNLSFILIGVGDVLIAGRHSTDTLAAISIATAITNCIQIFGIGILTGISPLISNYRGENITAEKYFYPTLRFSMFLALLGTIVTLLFIPVIDILKFDPVLTPMIKQYMFVIAFSTFGAYLQACVREFLQAFEIVMFPNLISGLAVVLNVILNIIFVFGWGIIPSMGALGLAIASFIVRYIMGAILLIYCFRKMKLSNYSDYNYYKGLLKIGLPVSISIVVEFVAFNSVAVILGKISGIYAASQNIICTLANATFMVPLAISNAIAIKVGFANGAKNIPDIKRYAFTGITISIMFMGCCGVFYGTFPEQVIKIFTTDADLIKISVPVVYILAMFQVFDGLQVSLSGVFKGIKKTGVVLFANFVGYWLIALPVGYILAFKYGMNIRGFWYGLILASMMLCVIMGGMLVRKLKG